MAADKNPKLLLLLNVSQVSRVQRGASYVDGIRTLALMMKACAHDPLVSASIFLLGVSSGLSLVGIEGRVFSFGCHDMNDLQMHGSRGFTRVNSVARSASRSSCLIHLLDPLALSCYVKLD